LVLVQLSNDLTAQPIFGNQNAEEFYFGPNPRAERKNDPQNRANQHQEVGASFVL